MGFSNAFISLNYSMGFRGQKLMTSRNFPVTFLHKFLALHPPFTGAKMRGEETSLKGGEDITN
jgi:hypothetical protein